MSSTAITSALVKAKMPTASRLEVVNQTIAPQAKTIPLVIRLPSGITIELAHQEMLTDSLLTTLSSMGATHAASR